MARRSLSTKGRILAAGVSIAVGGALAGFMAAGDHSADATQTTTPAPSANPDQSGSGSTGTPYDGRSSDDGFGASNGDTSNGSSSFPPQPQTRTGGS